MPENESLTLGERELNHGDHYLCRMYVFHGAQGTYHFIHTENMDQG